jgi:multisubunit Na+/H+ antiporter MnhE subunit|tara:strand:- start:388 stop:564 length:177 start_codon:yes stop_codon:yes gene_type:complete
MSKKGKPLIEAFPCIRGYTFVIIYTMIKTNIKVINSLSRKEKKANKRLYNKKVRAQKI